MLGIGITTHNNQHLLRGCIERVFTFTKTSYNLVVADDGSTDSTIKWCTYFQIPIITGKHKGKAWNTNRALYYLTRIESDPTIILEDNCWPKTANWEVDWVRAAYTHKNVNHEFLQVGSRVTSTLKRMIDSVGYYNSNFGDFDIGHLEWIDRFYRAGYIDQFSLPYLGDVIRAHKRRKEPKFLPAPLFGELSNLMHTQDWKYGAPWQNDNDKTEFEREITCAFNRTAIRSYC